jgi:hypothetical protein
MHDNDLIDLFLKVKKMKRTGILPLKVDLVNFFTVTFVFNRKLSVRCGTDFLQHTLPPNRISSYNLNNDNKHSRREHLWKQSSENLCSGCPEHWASCLFYSSHFFLPMFSYGIHEFLGPGPRRIRNGLLQCPHPVWSGSIQ